MCKLLKGIIATDKQSFKMQIEYEEHTNLIKKIAENYGIDKYDLKIEPGSETGDGYIGEMVRVTIQTNKKDLNIILKLAPTNESYTEGTQDMFAIEIFVYDKVFPAFERFQRDNGVLDGFDAYPKCFGTCAIETREAIAMDNLTVKGYRLWNRYVPMDHHHLALVVKEYGKFHAVSMGIRQKDPNLFEEFKQFFNKPISEEQRQEMKLFVATVLGAVTKAVKGYSKLESALTTLADTSEDFLLHEISAKENQLVVIHGDGWCNNILFKYEDSLTASKVRLIDWQLAKIGSPVVDVAYFFATSSSKETLYDYQTYLKIYHDSLSETLRNLGCDPELIYPFSLLQEQCKKLFKITVYLSPLVFPFLLIDKEEINIVDDAKNIGDYVEKMSGTRAAEEVDQRIRDLVEFTIDNNFI